MNKEQIIARVPEFFWAAFAGELVSVFGVDVFDKDSDGLRGTDYLTGTAGWNKALRMTCAKLDMQWFWDWYDKLDWWESDKFDGELCNLIESNFIDPGPDARVNITIGSLISMMFGT